MVFFDPSNHTYTTDDGKLIECVSNILRANEIAPSYDVVSKDILEQSAQFGTMVHAAFETFIKSDGTDDGADEYVMDFADNIYPSLSECKSEVIVYCVGNAPMDYAGTADLICKKDGRWIVADVKTTSTVHKEAVRWQTSLYKYAWGKQNGVPYESIDIACIHARNGQCKWYDLIPVTIEELEDLLTCTKLGIPRTAKTVVPSDLSSRAIKIQDTINGLKAQIKALEDDEKAIRAELLEFMKTSGAIKLEFGNVSISYIAPTTKNSVDTEKLKSYYPQVYSSVLKQTEVKESLRITTKK